MIETRALPATTDLLALHRQDPRRYPVLLESVASGTAQGRWDFLLVADGTGLRLDADGITRDLAGGVEAGDFLAAPRSKYDITDGGAQTVDGRSTRALKLLPKKGSGSAFTRATVWVDDQDGLIRQFEVSESNGITRRIRLTALSLNAAVDRDAFKFSVPKGVKVVDRTS